MKPIPWSCKSLEELRAWATDWSSASDLTRWIVILFEELDAANKSYAEMRERAEFLQRQAEQVRL